MCCFEVIPINQENKWRELVEKTSYKDLHFLPEYLSLLGEHIDASCYLFFYGNNDSYILYPFFKRKINDLLFSSENIDEIYWDVISPWYYGGPLFYGDIKEYDISNFLSELYTYYEDENIISGFSRFHPYVDNHKKMDSLIRLEKIGTVVWIDLTKDLDYIFNNSFTSSCRRAIRKSEKIGVDVDISNSKRDLKAFYNLYINAMNAKGASKFYYFTHDFLSNLKRKLKNSFLLITAKYKDEIVGGDIFLYKYDKIYYYLGARDPKYPETNAQNRIFYEVIKFGKNNGLKTFDLGGGSEGSSLLRFKKGFSNNILNLYGWKKVFNKDKYITTCKIIGIRKKDIKFEESPFFPDYRK